MELKSIIYDAIDKLALEVFPRAEYYRDLGLQYKEHIKNELPKVFKALGKGDSCFLERNLEEYGNFAYLDVQGQTLLIDMDICNIDIEKMRPLPNRVAFAVGLLWYSIKLIDNYIDENRIRKSELEDFLAMTIDSWKNDKRLRIPHFEKNILINSTSFLINSGYVGTPKSYIAELEGLCDAEVESFNCTHKEKINAAKVIGRKSAELTTALTKQYIPEYPNGCERFLAEQGITGKLLDDFKDRNIDREFGRGYETKEIPNLIVNGLKHFYRHFGALPNLGQKWKNLNFIVLASLFHVRELTGKKERS